MDDVRAVMDAACSGRAAIFGVSEGGPMSALFAATYPNRTDELVLYGTFARAPDYPWRSTTAESESMYEHLAEHWGKAATCRCSRQVERMRRRFDNGGEGWSEWELAQATW
jgi:pimeloyl-ACP methyl ester carboxylesterase